MINLIFFGSFLHYSTYVAKALHQSNKLNLIGVVTTPPMPAGRKKQLQKTHTHLWAEEQGIPVFTPEELTSATLEQITTSLRNSSNIKHPGSNIWDQASGIKHPASSTIDLFITCGYGKLIPKLWLDYPQLGSLNLHLSLLPSYRGANPAEYALMRGEAESGVTLIEMGEEFDTGSILAQAPVEIEPHDTRETLYEKLYQLGADCIEEMIVTGIQHQASGIKIGFPQPHQSPTPEAKRLHRRDGYITWEALQQVMQGQQLEPRQIPTALKKAQVSKVDAKVVERTMRALFGYPGLWTRIPTPKGQKLMKLFSAQVKHNALQLDTVQLEGQQPASFNQIKNQIISKSSV